MSEKILFAFDFDHTILDCNSDTFVRDKFLKDKVPECSSCENWTDYMQQIFDLLHQKNVGVSQITDAIGALPPTKEMLSLLLYLQRPDCEVIIISDANSCFIDAWLTAKKVHQAVNQVYTNPAHEDVNGALHLTMYQLQDWCKLCTKNLCKGDVLMGHVSRRLSEGTKFCRVVYIGDGKNDYCPSLKLSSSDFVFARSGFRLAKLLQGCSEVHATVHVWSNAQEIIDLISRLFTTIE